MTSLVCRVPTWRTAWCASVACCVFLPSLHLGAAFTYGEHLWSATIPLAALVWAMPSAACLVIRSLMIVVSVAFACFVGMFIYYVLSKSLASPASQVCLVSVGWVGMCLDKVGATVSLGAGLSLGCMLYCISGPVFSLTCLDNLRCKNENDVLNRK